MSTFNKQNECRFLLLTTSCLCMCVAHVRNFCITDSYPNLASDIGGFDTLLCIISP